MINHRNFFLFNKDFAADRAFYAVSKTGFGAGRSFSGNSFSAMVNHRNFFLFNKDFAANRAFYTIGKTGCSAGCRITFYSFSLGMFALFNFGIKFYFNVNFNIFSANINSESFCGNRFVCAAGARKLIITAFIEVTKFAVRTGDVKLFKAFACCACDKVENLFKVCCIAKIFGNTKVCTHLSKAYIAGKCFKCIEEFFCSYFIDCFFHCIVIHFANRCNSCYKSISLSRNTVCDYNCKNVEVIFVCKVDVIIVFVVLIFSNIDYNGCFCGTGNGKGLVFIAGGVDSDISISSVSYNDIGKNAYNVCCKFLLVGGSVHLKTDGEFFYYIGVGNNSEFDVIFVCVAGNSYVPGTYFCIKSKNFFVFTDCIFNCFEVHKFIDYIVDETVDIGKAYKIKSLVDKSFFAVGCFIKSNDVFNRNVVDAVSYIVSNISSIFIID